jgi:hypothetical protein
MQRNLTRVADAAATTNQINGVGTAAGNAIRDISGVETLNPPIDPNAQVAGAVTPEVNPASGDIASTRQIDSTTGEILNNTLTV